jgi:hypothetical protein
VGQLGSVEGLKTVVSHLDVVLDLRLLRLGVVSLRSLRSFSDEPQLRVSGVLCTANRIRERGQPSRLRKVARSQSARIMRKLLNEGVVQLDTDETPTSD